MTLQKWLVITQNSGWSLTGSEGDSRCTADFSWRLGRLAPGAETLETRQAQRGAHGLRVAGLAAAGHRVPGLLGALGAPRGSGRRRQAG